jgi:hypothetical protein
MQKFQLPHVILPIEFVSLLKLNITATTSSQTIFDIIRPNQALYMSLEHTFREFDEGRGLEKTMTALGWLNFRDRMASMYVYKSIHGLFPLHSSMDLVEDIKTLEHRFTGHSIQGVARIFLLGFYLKLANVQIQHRENNKFIEISVPSEINSFLKLSHGRSEKIDWLILILMHLNATLGDKLVLNAIATGKKLEELYGLLSTDSRKFMHDNLLAYGASINEPDLFLYDKI